MAKNQLIARMRAHVSRRPGHASQPSQKAPWWVNLLTDAGRPLVALIVLIMCAPGEHHLARLAGWHGQIFGIDLAWGMPSVLAAYAGIAAAVASKRPEGARGKVSAVLGAWVALAAAMAAQALSHAIITGHVAVEPRVPLVLVLSVSAVPALVFGHLLHLAATPVSRGAAQPAVAPVLLPATPPVEPVPAPEDEDDEPETPEDEDETGEEEPATQSFLSTQQVAERYGVTTSTVRSWKERGRITPVLADPRLGNLYDPVSLPELHAVAG